MGNSKVFRVFTRGSEAPKPPKEAHFDIHSDNQENALDKAGRLLLPLERVTYVGELPDAD